MPDDLTRQVEPLLEAVEALGWPVLCVDGVEADDVIATLVAQATARGWRTVISTGDKDLTQLVDERTLWINTMSNEKLDVAGVTAKFGVPPDKIVDYLALIGDQIDNIPGVDKVGPKTACKWIVQYGSLEGVVEHANEITGLAGENLRKVLDWLPKARELLTVKRDVPLPFPFEKLTQYQNDPAKQRAQYERFGFKGLLREVEGAAAPVVAASPQAALFSQTATSPTLPEGPAGPAKRKYSTLLTEEEFEGLIKKLQSAPLVGFGPESVGTEPITARLVGMAFAFGGEAFYLPLGHEYPGVQQQIDPEKALEALRPWLERDDCRKVAQDAKFESHILPNRGGRLAGCVHDTV